MCWTGLQQDRRWPVLQAWETTPGRQLVKSGHCWPQCIQYLKRIIICHVIYLIQACGSRVFQRWLFISRHAGVMTVKAVSSDARISHRLVLSSRQLSNAPLQLLCLVYCRSSQTVVCCDGWCHVQSAVLALRPPQLSLFFCCNFVLIPAVIYSGSRDVMVIAHSGQMYCHLSCTAYSSFMYEEGFRELVYLMQT